MCSRRKTTQNRAKISYVSNNITHTPACKLKHKCVWSEVCGRSFQAEGTSRHRHHYDFGYRNSGLTAVLFGERKYIRAHSFHFRFVSQFEVRVWVGGWAGLGRAGVMGRCYDYVSTITAWARYSCLLVYGWVCLCVSNYLFL